MLSSGGGGCQTSQPELLLAPLLAIPQHILPSDLGEYCLEVGRDREGKGSEGKERKGKQKIGSSAVSQGTTMKKNYRDVNTQKFYKDQNDKMNIL